MKEIIKNLKIYFKTYLRDFKKEILQTFIFVTLSIGIGIALPIIISFFIDNLYNVERTSSFFKSIAVIYLMLLITKIILETVNSYVSERLSWSVSNKLRVSLVKHCINLDFAFHKSHKTGEMIERIDGDVTFLSNFFSVFLVNILGNGLFVLMVIIIFYIKNMWIGLSYSIMAMLAYAVFSSLSKKITKLWSIFREDEAQNYGFIQETILAREDIVGIEEESYFKKMLKKLLIKTKKDYRNASIMNNIPTSGFFGLMNIGDFVAMAIGVYLFYKGQMTIGSIYLISNYIGLLNRPFIALRFELENLQKVGASLSRISELFDLKSNISSGNKKLSNKTPSVDVKNISFAYDDVKVLENISLSVKAGEKIGIVGKTGSGKSTFIKLLSKMYDLKNGDIYIEGKNLKDLDIDDFYKHMCVMNQNSRIFKGTVYENLSSFDSLVTREKAVEALKKVGLSRWLKKLPNGIDTVVDKSMVSSAEEQLLYVSKAFLTDAKIFVFDEINSKLDDESEQKICQALRKIISDSTAFIIAHRLKMLEIVDKVLILENGRVKLFDDKNNVSEEIIRRNLE